MNTVLRGQPTGRPAQDARHEGEGRSSSSPRAPVYAKSVYRASGLGYPHPSRIAGPGTPPGRPGVSRAEAGGPA